MFPPLCTQCPGERCPCPSRSEQLPPAGSTGQLARAVTTATGTGGPGGWRAPGRPPAAPPLGWVPVGRGGVAACKVTLQSPLPGRQTGGCRSHAGPSIPDLRYPALFQDTHRCLLWGTRCFVVFLWFGCFSFLVSLWELGGAHSRVARSRRRGRGPRYPLAVAPSHSPTWMYAIFARAHSLRPGHGVATDPLPSPVRRGGTAAGKTPVGGRVAPDVTGVTDERRPPLRRPPRPCPALRGRLPGAQNRDAPRSPASAFGGPAPTLTPWGAPGLQ